MKFQEEINRCFAITIVCSLLSFSAFAQYPSPHNLGAGEFNFTGFALGTTQTYPASMGGFSITGHPGTATLDGTMVAETLSQNGTGVTNYNFRNEVNNGLSLHNNFYLGSNQDIGAILVAINTTGEANTTVSFTARDVYSKAGVVVALRLQYRVGTTGDFTDVMSGGSPVEYLSSATAAEAAAGNFDNIVLPGDVDNQPVVHLRWLYYKVSPATVDCDNGLAPCDNFLGRMGVDQILITSNTPVSSYPAVHGLASGDFTFTGFVDNTSTTYPTSLRGYSHVFGFPDTNASNLLDGVVSDELLRPNSVSPLGNRVRNEGTSGISIQDNHNVANATANLGSILVAINTQNMTGVTVTWTGRHIFDRTTSQHRMQLQYRIGTSGDFTAVPAAGEYTSGLSGLAAPATFNDVPLPAEVENQDEVHVRWVYYQVGGATAAAHDRVAVDNIEITGSFGSGISLDPEYVDAVLDSGNQFVTAPSIPGAVDYEFEIDDNGGPMGTVTWIANGPAFNLAYLDLFNGDPIEYNRDYTIRVRPRDGGGTPLFDYGDPVTITTPATIPQTQLVTADCNSTVSSLNEIIFINQVPFVDDYEYEISSPTDPGFGTVTYFRGRNAANFRLSFVPGTLVDETYDIRVRPIVNGANGTYGTTCQVDVLPIVPAISLQGYSCDFTLSNVYGSLYSQTVPGASSYSFQIFPASGGLLETFVSTDHIFKLTETNLFANRDLLPNTTYRVRVRATVNGLTGNYGSFCTVTTPDFPLVTNSFLVNNNCGIVLDSLGQLLKARVPQFALPAPGGGGFPVDGYEFQIRDGLDQTIETFLSADSVFAWNELVETYETSTTYRVYVRVIEETGVKEGTFFTFCEITTPAGMPMARVLNENAAFESEPSLAGSIDSFHGTKVYPNPFVDYIQIDSPLAGSTLSVNVHDMRGRLVYSQLFDDGRIAINGSSFLRGMYIVSIDDGSSIFRQRLLKK